MAGVSPLPVEPVRLSTRLVRAYERRLSGLPEATRRALLLVAVAGSADDAVAEALAEQDLGFGDLEPAEAADLLGRDDGDDRSRGAGLHFRHPLIRSAVYHAATPGRKRAAHRALAAVHGRRAGPGRRRAPGLPPGRGDPGHRRGRGRAAHRRGPRRGRPQQPRHRAGAARTRGAAQPVGSGPHPPAAGGGPDRADRRERRGGDAAARPGPDGDRRPRSDHHGVPPAVPRADVERPAHRGPRRAARPRGADPRGRPGAGGGDAQPGRAAEPDDRRPAPRPRRGERGRRGRGRPAAGGPAADRARPRPGPGARQRHRRGAGAARRVRAPAGGVGSADDRPAARRRGQHLRLGGGAGGGAAVAGGRRAQHPLGRGRRICCRSCSRGWPRRAGATATGPPR